MIYNYNLSVFYNENCISYYLLGAFITDGCVYQNNKNTYACQLSSCDLDWLESIKNIVGTNLKIHKFTQNYYGLRIIRHEIASWLISHGCYPRKTYSIVLPNIPDQYFRDFLRGCIDGDGSIGIYPNKNNIKRSCQLISASKIFLEQIQNKLKLLNIKATITNRGKQTCFLKDRLIKATVDSYSLNFYGQNCYKFLKYIYYDTNQIALNRKKQLAIQIINYYNSLPNMDLRKNRKLNVGCKINWLEDNELIDLIRKSNVEQVAKVIGVSGSAIRKRLKRRNLYEIVQNFKKITEK